MSWGFSNVNAGIDLRQEIRDLFYGNEEITPIGQWVIYRRYDYNKKSIYYNEITREGVDGPKYQFIDELLLTYKWNNPMSTDAQNLQPGLLSTPQSTFIFEYTVNPKEFDEIYEFDWCNNLVTPVLNQIPKPYKYKFNIRSVATYRLDNARKEYFLCKTTKESIS